MEKSVTLNQPVEKIIESKGETELEKDKGVENCEIIDYLTKQFALPNPDIRTYSPLTLAYIGDGIYDLIIRTMIVNKGNAPVNKLHKAVSGLVKASAQMNLLYAIEDQLTQEEMGVYKRGRNAKSFTSAKNASITEYRVATGLEALIGYLYLMNRMDRCVELIKKGLQDSKELKASETLIVNSEKLKRKK